MSETALFACNTMNLLAKPNKTDENTLLRAQLPCPSPTVQPIGLRKPITSREKALKGQNSLMRTMAPDTNPKQAHLRYK